MAAISATIVLAALAGTVFGGVTLANVRLTLVVAVAVLAASRAVRRFRAEAPGFERYVESVEGAYPEARSLLRNAVDFGLGVHEGTSPQLADAVMRNAAERIERIPLRKLEPPVRPLRPALVAGVGAVLLIAAAAFFPQQIQRSWRTLWNPALAAPPVAIEVQPGSVKVAPGASLAVYARVSGTRSRPRLERTVGSAVDGVLESDAEGRRLWRFDLAQLTTPQRYEVRVSGRRSPQYQISLAGEPAPVGFEIEYRAPAYARLPIQRGSAIRGDLTALRGSKARLVVTFDRDLTELSARLGPGDSRPWRQLTARRWEGEIPIERDEPWDLRATAAGGEASFRYRIQSLQDAPPVIAVRTPSGNVDLPAGQQVPLEVFGQDDLGLSELRLQYRKDPAAPWTDLGLARFDGGPREALVRKAWDVAPLALLPGETAVFRFELFDGNAVSGRGRAVSPTFELRFPSLADLYESIEESQSGVQHTLEKAAEQARELQKSIDRMARQPASRMPTETPPSFEHREELRQNLERQQELGRQLDQASQQLQKTLDQAAERQAFEEELQRRLTEMSELMKQIESPEFKDAMKKMQEALENLDKRSMEQQLPQWRDENQKMLKNLERTIELLKKLREEEEMNALARRAEELKARQDELNREHEAREKGQDNAKQQPSDRLAAEQQKESEASKQLAADAKEMAEKSESGEDRQDLEDAAKELEEQASEEQEAAAEASKQQQNSQAHQQGQKASESLSRSAQKLSKSAQRRQQQRANLDLAAIRRQAQDLVSVQRELDSNLQSSRPLEERADKQTDLSEGVSRIADSLDVLAKSTPFLSPQLKESLGRAMQGLSNSGKELGSGNRGRGEQSGTEAGSALNQAVLELRQSENSMCQNPGEGNDGKPSLGQQMQRLGQKQSQLNQRSESLAQQLSQQMRLSTGDREQLNRLAEEQSRLRQQLEQIERDARAREELLGRLDQTQRDMQEVEEAFRTGTTDGDLEEKQQRILSRLLDAQRSVNRRDFNPERESRVGENLSAPSAPELPQELLRESDRLRNDLLKAEADRYPAQYRALIEAYLRSLNGTRR